MNKACPDTVGRISRDCKEPIGFDQIFAGTRIFTAGCTNKCTLQTGECQCTATAKALNDFIQSFGCTCGCTRAKLNPGSENLTLSSFFTLACFYETLDRFFETAFGQLKLTHCQIHRTHIPACCGFLRDLTHFCITHDHLCEEIFPFSAGTGFGCLSKKVKSLQTDVGVRVSAVGEEYFACFKITTRAKQAFGTKKGVLRFFGVAEDTFGKQNFWRKAGPDKIDFGCLAI